LSIKFIYFLVDCIAGRGTYSAANY